MRKTRFVHCGYTWTIMWQKLEGIGFLNIKSLRPMPLNLYLRQIIIHVKPWWRNLVFPIFFHGFFSFWAVENNNFLLVQNSLFSLFAGWKRQPNKYLLKFFLDSEFIVWWFDSMSLLVISNVILLFIWVVRKQLYWSNQNMGK